MQYAPKDLHDPIGRRRRIGKRQPDGTIVTLHERDIKILEFIHLYGGMLSTDVIWEFAKRTGLYKNRMSLSHRLTQLWHDAGVIERPIEQTYVRYPDRYHLVHRVSERGEDELKARHLFSPYAPRPWGVYKHNMLNAGVYASYAISAMDAGITLIPQHILLADLKRDSAITVDGKVVRPDTLFKLIVGEKEVLVFLEIDRATETGHSSSDKKKSWGRSVKEYQKIISEKRYKEHYNVPSNFGAQVHVVTTTFPMQQKILREVQREFPKGCSYILTSTCVTVGEETHSAPYMDMLKTVWDRQGFPPFCYVKADS